MRLKLVILSFLVCTASWAQQQDETEYRLELGGGAGAAINFTDVSRKIGATGALIARFPLNPRMAIKAQFSYLAMKGDTEGSDDFYPANPNASGETPLSYSVSDGIYDLSGLYEIHFLPYGYLRDYRGYSRIVPYLQMGIGLTYGGAGKAFTANIPIGVGLKYKVGKRLNLGLDWMIHFSLSDKLEGLEAPLGITSSGFRNKDHYSGLTLTLTYDLNPRCPTCNRD